MDSRALGRFAPVVLVATLLAMGEPVLAARSLDDDSSGSSRSVSRSQGEDEDQPDVRERTVGGSYPLEKELDTDRSFDTWLYVFSAVMLLCVGWLCFKPTRLYTGKKEGGLLAKLRKSSDKKTQKKGK
ncbi:MAG: hypothetical protein JXQ73_18980 [Phycisphaerae bacterium]|nr:hypothetical protein [Phycisphaerae bacterium]